MNQKNSKNKRLKKAQILIIKTLKIRKIWKQAKERGDNILRVRKMMSKFSTNLENCMKKARRK
jgi:hypothetical protein